MDMSGRHLRLFAGHVLAAFLVSTGIVTSTTYAQDLGWREFAERESQRAADARRAELIRMQYERRRSAAHARMRMEDDSGLFASTPSTTDAQLSCPALPVSDTGSVLDRYFSQRSDGTLLIDIGDGASWIGPRAAGASPPWWPDRLAPILRGSGTGPDFAAAHAGLLASPGWDAQSAAGGGTVHSIPLVPSASDAHGRQGIVQVRNGSDRAGEVRIVAVDDSGREYGPLSLFVEANGAARFNSDDLENGNPDKTLYGSTGPGVGDWRLELLSDVLIEAQSFVRTWDGTLMPMHDTVASEGTRHNLPIFHPASQWEQESRLRLINSGDGPAAVTIAGIDSHGQSPGTGVSVTIPAGASLTYTSAELEIGNGPGLRGSLGEGTGAWRLIVDSAQPLQVMNLLSSPTGHLSNLSTAPSNETQGIHGVPLLPSASDPSGRGGLVRVINRTDTAGQVRINAFNDTQRDYAPLVLSLGAGESAQFDSNDLEQGNAGRGLAGGTGPGEGDWRLELSSDLDIEVLSYVRAWDGLLTAMHDVAPGDGTRYRVASFDPQGDPEQESLLRLINPGSTPAQVTISGEGSLDASPGGEVSVTIPAGASRTYTATELSSGEGAGLAGSLGDATAERQLLVESQQPLQVMSLLSGPAGRLTNLSTGPVRGVPIPLPLVGMDTHGSGTETIEDVFGSEVSPIVQAKCVLCHVQGGVSGTTRLVFVAATNADHEALNLQVFRDFLQEVDDGANVVLNKVQGVAHGGGVQAAAGTEDYANLQRFLGLLGEAVSSISITPDTLFDGVTMEAPRQTLRRAALVLAGRVPTEAEYATVDGGSEDALRTAIRGLMTGPGFHEFLVRASNDRLFTDRDWRVLEDSGEGFVDFARKIYSLNQREGTIEAANRYIAQAQYGFRRAPLELIAHVAENNLPYTEILTANYVMANPMAAEAYGAATAFENPQDVHEFKPSEIVNYFRPCEGREVERRELGYFVVDPGPCATQIPYAGILSTKVFLQRYPTTATNRNRARSRWTYYHFLGLDIEKSASRTTDPVALADTNNPTMNNPACTVCHTLMDPLAGTFQNYGDTGLYRDQWGGMDALDRFYKYNPSGREDFQISSRSRSGSVTALGTQRLLALQQYDIGIKNLRTFEGDTKLHLGLGEVTVRDSSGDVVSRYKIRDVVNDDDCGGPHGDDEYKLWDCAAELLLLPLSVEKDGDYRVEVEAWVLEPGEMAATMQVWIGGPFYRQGDTWYRDMRSPGFDGRSPANDRDSLHWLATQIAKDPRFAEAAVKFWWPAIMGKDVAEPPEDESDADFDGRLLASNAQSAEVTRLADGFRSGFHAGAPYNLKDLLVEIVLSKWFRAESVSEENVVQTAALQGAGARRLLTPEELARKTLALTGFQWGRRASGPHMPPAAEGTSNLTDPGDGYALLYGGIDSDGITERARELSSVMAGVAQTHALQSSYPIVMREFYLLPEEQRILFEGVDIAVTPTFEFGDTFAIVADSQAARESLSLRGQLNAGLKTVSMTFLNDHYQEEPREDRNIRLDRLVIRNAEGEVIETFELDAMESTDDCNRPAGQHFAMNCAGSLDVQFTVPADGLHMLEVLAWADHGGDELPMLEIAIHSDTESSGGAHLIKSKLIELYDKLHGVSVTTDSAEVQDAYGLFVEVWENKRGVYGNHFLWNDEEIGVNWATDEYFFDHIDEDFWRKKLNEHGDPLGWDWDRINAFHETVDWSDPQAVARTWAVVLAYLMMDYRYLYL